MEELSKKLKLFQNESLTNDATLGINSAFDSTNNVKGAQKELTPEEIKRQERLKEKQAIKKKAWENTLIMRKEVISIVSELYNLQKQMLTHISAQLSIHIAALENLLIGKGICTKDEMEKELSEVLKGINSESKAEVNDDAKATENKENATSGNKEWKSAQKGD